jgi:hypothetical protein
MHLFPIAPIANPPSNSPKTPALRSSVPFEFVANLAIAFDSVECFWRESDRSFTGFVAEVWFDNFPADFAWGWAKVVNYPVRVRRIRSGPAKFTVSIPCTIG